MDSSGEVVDANGSLRVRRSRARARCGVDIWASLVSLFWRAATASAKTIANTVSDIAHSYEKTANCTLNTHVSSTGQLFPASFRSLSANFVRIRKGIANSCPSVKITFSNTQPFFLRTLISLHGTSNGGCMKRNRNMLAK